MSRISAGLDAEAGTPFKPTPTNKLSEKANVIENSPYQ